MYSLILVRLSIRLAYSCIFHPCIFDRVSHFPPPHFQSARWLRMRTTSTAVDAAARKTERCTRRENYRFADATELLCSEWRLYAAPRTRQLRCGLSTHAAEWLKNGANFTSEICYLLACYAGWPKNWHHFYTRHSSNVDQFSNLFTACGIVTSSVTSLALFFESFFIKTFMTMRVGRKVPQRFDARDIVSASEMTYIVSGGALNSTHSLTQWRCRLEPWVRRPAARQRHIEHYFIKNFLLFWQRNKYENWSIFVVVKAYKNVPIIEPSCITRYSFVWGKT